MVNRVVDQLRALSVQIASPYGGLRSVLITVGPQSRRTRSALAKNRRAAPALRRWDK